MNAIWTLGSKNTTRYAPLSEDADADVAIIGAGITGLTTALALAEAGQKVIVLEAREVGAGVTGGSTGNLYSPLASGQAPIRKKWGDEVSRDVISARSEAVDAIEALVERFAIDCQFQRQPAYRVEPVDDGIAGYDWDAEKAALADAGLDVEETGHPGLPFATKGIKISGQAQFNPLHYVQGLARAASDTGVVIHEHSPARSVDHKQGTLSTDTACVSARHIVYATHTPKGINLLQAGMLVSREYAVSARLKSGDYPEGIIWAMDPFHSLRSYREGDEHHVMVIGEKHKTGHQKEDHYRQLQKYLQTHFDVESFTSQWSAQQYSSPDGLPYIGRLHGHDNVYLATGFAADGLAWGALAAMMISDQVLGRDNRWQARFDARRFTPGKSAAQYAKENVHVAHHMFKDYLGAEKLKEAGEVAPGQAVVAKVDGQQLAIHRTADGQLKVLSAVCPHLKCIVHWNNMESTWDCPCHGSRFDCEGEVIEGPSYHPLARRTR